MTVLLLFCIWMGGACYPNGYWALLIKVLGIAVMIIIILLIWWLYRYGDNGLGD